MISNKLPRSKIRVAKSAQKKKGFQFRWWMAVGMVMIIAGIGIVIVQISQASYRGAEGIDSVMYCNAGDCREHYFWGAVARNTKRYPSQACISGYKYATGFKVTCIRS